MASQRTVATGVSVPVSADRFEFGENWWRFLALVDDERVTDAQRSLDARLAGAIEGASFLDIGSGSGLFSLAAVRLGAARVHSFDVDPQCVACARELKRRFAPSHDQWTIEQGSVLDAGRLTPLGQFDIVYAWGVLHHTGAMYEALANAAEAVAPGGRLFVAIYNDQGWRSRAWRIVKRTYGRVPTALRVPYARLVMMPSELLRALNAARRGRLPSYVRDRRRFKPGRGMSRRHDLIDWVGGYPFEVARPEQVIEFACARGFKLLWLKTVRSIGNNQFVFERPAG